MSIVESVLKRLFVDNEQDSPKSLSVGDSWILTLTELQKHEQATQSAIKYGTKVVVTDEIFLRGERWFRLAIDDGRHRIGWLVDQNGNPLGLTEVETRI